MHRIRITNQDIHREREYRVRSWRISWRVLLVPANLVTLPAWIYRILATRYTLTSKRLITRTGILARSEIQLELFRARRLTSNQGILERFLGIGQVSLSATQPAFEESTLEGVSGPHALRDTIQELWDVEKRVHGVEVYRD